MQLHFSNSRIFKPLILSYSTLISISVTISETRIRHCSPVSRVGDVSDTDTPGIRPGYVSTACPRIPSYLGWKLTNGNFSAQSTRYGPAQLTTIPFSFDLLPTPSHAQSPPAAAARTRRPGPRLPHAASRSAACRQPASALAGDEEPPRRRRRAAPGLQQRAPASRDGDEELRPRPFEIQQRRALAGCPPEEWNCGRRACLMSWRATTASTAAAGGLGARQQQHLLCRPGSLPAPFPSFPLPFLSNFYQSLFPRRQ